MDRLEEPSTTRPPTDEVSSPASDAIAALPSELVLSALVATIGERWTTWDAAREEAQVLRP